MDVMRDECCEGKTKRKMKEAPGVRGRKRTPTVVRP